MAWTITNRDIIGVNSAEPQVTIVMDSTSDAADLPTVGIAPGSVALATVGGLPAYMFGADKAWHNVD